MECNPSAPTRYRARMPPAATPFSSWRTSLTVCCSYRNAGRIDRCPKLIMQDGSAHSPARAAAELRADRVPFVAVGDPHDRRTRRVDAQPMQRRQRPRHQSLPACLVERAGAALTHNDVQPGPGVTRSAVLPAGGAAADDQHVKHRPALSSVQRGVLDPDPHREQRSVERP